MAQQACRVAAAGMQAGAAVAGRQVVVAERHVVRGVAGHV